MVFEVIECNISAPPLQFLINTYATTAQVYGIIVHVYWTAVHVNGISLRLNRSSVDLYESLESHYSSSVHVYRSLVHVYGTAVHMNNWIIRTYVTRSKFFVLIWLYKSEEEQCFLILYKKTIVYLF